MEFQSTRREFVLGSLLLPLTSPSTKAALDSPTNSNDKAVAALLRRRDELLEQRRQLDERWKIANARLPDWCKLGLKYRDRDGKDHGPLVGWPPITEPIPVAEHGYLVRPSPSDLRQLLQIEVEGVGRTKARQIYRWRIRCLRGQLAERRRISNVLNQPRTGDWLPIDLEIEGIEARLSAGG